MKHDPKLEEKILAEIRRKVLEAEAHNQEKADADSLRKATAEALKEMSSLGNDEINRIAYNVRKEMTEKAQKRKRNIVIISIFALIVLVIFGTDWLQQRQAEADRLARLNNKFIENFDNNNRNWLLFNELTYEKRIENGAYIIETGDASCYWDKTKINFPAHYAIELTSTWQRGEDKSEYGISLAQDNDHLLGFCLFPDGEAYYGHYRDGKWEKATDWSKKIANPEQQENLQRVEVKDNQSFKYFVNGTLAYEDTFSRIIPTQVGMRSCGKQVVEFNSLKVIDLANNKVIFEENFNDPKSLLWTPAKAISKTSSIENGKYLLETNYTDGCEWAAQNYKIDGTLDYDITLKVSHLAGETADFGLVLLQDNVNYYTFDYRNNGKARWNLYQIDKWTLVGNYKETNILSDKNKPEVVLKIELRGLTCKYYVNEMLIDTFTLDSSLSFNQIGLRSCNSQKVSFDELQIIPK